MQHEGGEYVAPAEPLVELRRVDREVGGRRHNADVELVRRHLLLRHDLPQRVLLVIFWIHRDEAAAVRDRDELLIGLRAAGLGRVAEPDVRAKFVQLVQAFFRRYHRQDGVPRFGEGARHLHDL